MECDTNLIIFVEGPDDQRFLRNYFSNQTNIQFFEYSTKKKETIKKYMQVIKKRVDQDYLFFADSDGKTIEDRKKDVLSTYCECEYDKIIVVCFEIESWYLAGISLQNREKMKIKKKFRCTDTLTKEFFDSTIPTQYRSRIDYMIEILKIFDLELAVQTNKSFCLFNKKMA